MDIDLTQKVGPLPAWGWGLVVGGIIVGVYYWQTKTVDPASAESTVAPTTYDAIDGMFTPGTVSGSGTVNNVASEQVDSNQAWALRAIANLVGKGKSPLTAQSAVMRYLNSETLSAEDKTLIDDVIRDIGSPPNLPENIAVVAPTPTPAVTIKQWQRLANGSIRVYLSNGKYATKTYDQYMTAGFPRFTINSYATKYYTVPTNGASLGHIASLYGTTSTNLMITNGWKTKPVLKKGQRIKVPGKKGNG